MTQVAKQVTMTIEQYLKLKPAPNQDNNGQNMIVEKKVTQIRKDVKAAIASPSHPVIVDLYRGMIISGHTRQEAAFREVEAGNLSPTYKFSLLNWEGLTDEEFANEVYLANNGPSHGNVKTHQINSNMSQTKMLIRPVFDVFKAIVPQYPDNIAYKLAPRVAALFNENSDLLQDLADGVAVAITAADLYASKGYDLTNKNFNFVVVNTDLRKYKRELMDLLRPFVEGSYKLIQDGTMREKFGNSTNFYYIWIALSLQKNISNAKRSKTCVTGVQIERAIRNQGRKLATYAKLFQNNPLRFQDSILQVIAGNKEI